VSTWFKNTASVLLILLTLGCPPVAQESIADISPDTVNLAGVPVSPHTSQPEPTVEVTNYFGDAFQILDVANLSRSEKRARIAAVKVKSLVIEGHGSGTYMIMYGRRVVVTAAHVVRDETTMLVEGRRDEAVVGRVVFRDEEADIAFIVVPEIKSRTAVRCRPQMAYDERLVGADLTYTGFPSHHDLLTIRGYVASLEHNYIVTNMFGWFGSSGSGVFDQWGRFVGVVSGIDVGRFLMPQPLEVIVWVAPVSQIDTEMLKVRILTAPEPGGMNAFPGAAAPRRGGLRN
jgi:hypothetical protein